ncbi:unnamed protein product [Clonostachys byssicola]|uniref:Uncharacterized protein n=1 Tax=Clonostachys byssicola TaxID=160290 RepID=A0A9N9U4N4_9HYPO|nr:unnamed protein product [Clonostachys byssicola]
MRLQGKVAVITGAAGNIGLETARQFLREGASVALVDLNAEALESAKTQLVPDIPTTNESHVLVIVTDSTSEDDTTRMFSEVVAKLGRLDCAFLNAGISYSSTPILDETMDRFDKVMNVNVRSGVKYAGMAMKELGNGGSIIITSSIAGLRGTPGMSIYATSKFALRGLSLTAAGELGPFGIRVNTVHPSGVNTPMFHATWGPEKIEELKKAMPLGRFAEVDDIAGVVVFLASDESKFMTGGMLKVDGRSVSF